VVYKDWASKTYEYKLNALKSNEYVDVIQIDEEIHTNSLEKYDHVIFGWNCISISKFYTTKRHYYCKKVDNLETKEIVEARTKLFDNIKNKYLIVQDFNCNHDYEGGVNGLIKYLRFHKITKIITPYLHNRAMNIIKSVLPDLGIVYVPHHIDETKFYNMNLEKKYDIFMYGNTSPNFYKFRNRLEKLLSNSNKFNFVQWGSIRNYFRYNSRVSDNNLSKIINQSWLTICTSSDFDLPLGKYFETSMSNSLVCGDIPVDVENIWQRNYLKLDRNDSDDVILDKIDKMLQNKKLMKELTDKAGELMKDYYLSKYGTKLVNKLLKDN
jgi:hypothetical protein